MIAEEKQSLPPTVRVVVDCLAYRFRMREANNLPVVITLAIASHFSAADVAARAAIALLLNALVYLINDYHDLDLDIADDARPREQVTYLAAHRPEARIALLSLALLAVAMAALYAMQTGAWTPLVGTTVGFALVWLYSALLKRIPVVDIASMAVAGACGALLGIQATAAGFLVAGFIGLVCGSFNALQVIRDHDTDRASGVRTSAVVLGPAAAGWIFRALITAGVLYGFCVVKSLAALFLLGALLLDLKPASAARAWDITRLLGGLSWAGLLLELYLNRL